MFTRGVLRYTISTLVLFLFGLYPIAVAFAHEGKYGGWSMGPGMMDGWGMGWFGGVFMIIFWILILVGLIMVIRWLFQSSSKKGYNSQPGSRAIDILKERYARGEIDKTQFETMKRDLAD